MSKKLLLFIGFLLITSLGFAQAKLEIRPSNKTFCIGGPLELNYTITSPLKSGAWVGLYHTSNPHNSSKGYLTYAYVHDASSKNMSFDAPYEAGDYEFRLFDSGSEEELTRTSFTVRNIDPREISMTIATEEIKQNNPFMVAIESELVFNPKAWVGIYAADADTSTHSGYISYEYIRAMQANQLEMQSPMTTGAHELRFYIADPGVLVKRLPFYVGDLNIEGLAFSPNKVAYEPEEDVIVTYTGHEDLTSRAWIGTFPVDADAEEKPHQDYLGYQYLVPRTGGTVYLKAPTEKGDYELRMFYADNGPMLLEAVPFEVTRSLDKSFLAEKIETEGKVVLYGIYFDTDKSEIKAASFPLIAQIAEILQADSNLRIRIEGHTDSVGEAAYNQLLSERRALAILNMLVEKHQIPSEQLETIGHGEKQPVGDNISAAGRAQNRRVELIKLN